VSDLDKRAAFSVSPAVPVRPAPVLLSPTVTRWHKPVFILFLLTWAINLVALLLRVDLPNGEQGIEAAFLLLGVATSLLGLARRLALQNVLMAAVQIACLSGGIVAVGTLSGVPFGPVVFSDRFGDKIFNAVPWPLPLLWVMLIINGRGVARLIMRPWRKTNFYGFWVIGLTCALAATFDLGFEPLGVYVKDWWVWQTGELTLSWYKAPWVNFLGWFMTALGVLAFTIPWLINKQPVKQPMDYHPLIVWLLLNLGLVAVNASRGFWPAAALGLGANVVAAVYAIRGARW
jgi:uncharacterized membrane protein